LFQIARNRTDQKDPKVYLPSASKPHSLPAMEKQDHQKPTSPDCKKCGQQPNFVTSMLEPKAGRAFHMFQCECGEKSWTSDKT
jgi:hypothetical protein